MYSEQGNRGFNRGGNRGGGDRGFSGGSFGGNRGGFGGGNAPVNVGDTLDVKIEAVGEKGDGIAKKNGFVIFVPGAKTGTTVHVKITRVLKKMAFSEVLGQAQGASEASSQEEAAEEAPAEEQEDFSGEDSDSFGEEDSQDEKEEEKFE